MRRVWAPVAVIAGGLLLSAVGSASADRCDRNGYDRARYSGSYGYYPAAYDDRYDRYDRDDRGYWRDRDDRRDRERWRFEEVRRHRIAEEREERRERRERERAHERWERAHDRDRDRDGFRRDRWYRD